MSKNMSISLKLLAKQKVKKKLLQEKLLAGEQSGETKEFHLKTFIKKKLDNKL